MRPALNNREGRNPETTRHSGEYPERMQLSESAGGGLTIAEDNRSALPVQRRCETEMEQRSNLIRRRMEEDDFVSIEIGQPAHCPARPQRVRNTACNTIGEPHNGTDLPGFGRQAGNQRFADRACRDQRIFMPECQFPQRPLTGVAVFYREARRLFRIQISEPLRASVAPAPQGTCRAAPESSPRPLCRARRSR